MRLLAFLFGSEPTKQSTPHLESANSTPPGDTPNADPPGAVAAADLVSAYAVNELAGERIYGGRRLVVTGGMASVRRRSSGGFWLALSAEPTFGGVWCRFSDEAAKELAELQHGDSVVVEGKVSDTSALTVFLDECVLVRTPEPDGAASAKEAA
jgi:hypothetical protein